MIEIAIETELSGRPNPPWRADGARPPLPAPPPPATAKARTVFGLAGELKNLVREDRLHRSQHARQLKRAGKSR
ncbi:MAG: hypothetical protein HYW28_11810 [Rhodospirillales bacterium]|nr:hypothetical protein [Rhodospirillales bacterium]MBI2977254.1 hypothetical protein [Rhodospirillales bacterium]